MGLVIFHYKIRKDAMLVLRITNTHVGLTLNAMPFLICSYDEGHCIENYSNDNRHLTQIVCIFVASFLLKH